MTVHLDKEHKQAENAMRLSKSSGYLCHVSQQMQVIFCKLNFVQAVKFVNVTPGTFLKYYLNSLLINSSLLPGRFGSLPVRPSGLLTLFHTN